MKCTIFTCRLARALSQVFDVSVQSLCLILVYELCYNEQKIPLLPEQSLFALILWLLLLSIFFFTTEDFSSLERNSSETIWRLRPTKLNRKEKHRISPLYLICCLMPLNYVVHIHCSLSLLQCSPAKPLTVLSECQALQLYDLAFQCANIMLKTSIQLSQKEQCTDFFTSVSQNLHSPLTMRMPCFHLVWSKEC